MNATSIRIVALALFAATFATTYPVAHETPDNAVPAAQDAASAGAKPVILAQSGCGRRCPP